MLLSSSKKMSKMNEHIEQPKYITARLQGGLGNQLFQIFTAIGLSKWFQSQPIFMNTRVSSDYPNTYRETYYHSLLDRLELYEEKEDEKYEWNLVDFDTVSCNPSTNNKIFGYFQNYMYFHHIAQQTIQHLQFQEKQVEAQQRNPQILSTVPFVTNVAIHFRLGDYKYKQEHHPLMSIQYYYNSIQYLLQHCLLKKENMRCILFYEQEDEETVLDLVRHLRIDTFVLTSSINDVDQFLLMSSCDVIITANSTFSWWAAYIGQTIRNTVIVTIPSRWFHTPTGNNYIVPGWLVIPS